MSATLLKKCLELADTPYERKEGKAEDTHLKYIVIKPIKKVKKKETHQRGVTDFHKRNTKTVERVKRNLKGQKDVSNESLKNLQLLKKPPINKKSVKIILERLGKLVPEKEPPKKEEGTVFTEEDFLRFEREYVDD